MQELIVYRDKGTIDINVIERYEKKIGYKFPKTYKELLSKHNGLYPENNNFILPDTLIKYPDDNYPDSDIVFLRFYECPTGLDNSNIEDYFINTELLREQNIDTHSDRYAKTITLLDNLNQAVKSVKSKGLKTIGVNVGLEMPGKAISSPAISDALKNHKRKILTLFEKYPNRWTELRTNFKPIQNLSKNEVNRLRMTN